MIWNISDRHTDNQEESIEETGVEAYACHHNLLFTGVPFDDSGIVPFPRPTQIYQTLEYPLPVFLHLFLSFSVAVPFFVQLHT